MDSPDTQVERVQVKARRFNGMEKTSRQWSCLRKVGDTLTSNTSHVANNLQDQDLWDEEANCHVHFNAMGSSQRPPSLKVPLATIQLSKCSPLLDNCVPTRKTYSSSPMSDSGYDSSTSSARPQQADTYELFIPAPAALSREQAYAYHITTRNFFALLMNQALVGEKLGQALVDLWKRAKTWLPEEDATAKLLSYCDQQGYLSLAENVAHATAILNLSEKAQIQELWTNAFVHCVGMHERLDLSSDYRDLSYITKALVTRASLEMDLHMSRVTRALGSFLEEELGANRLGLTKPARTHLDAFRCFLQTFYMEHLGYFPPGAGEPYNKRMWNNMRDDFQSLYDLLADTTSDRSMQNESNANGGICCLQVTQAFDARHGCDPLPHPSPLLPLYTPTKRSIDAQRTLRSLRLGRTASGTAVNLPPRKALADATNAISSETATRPIVLEYRRFERLRPDEKITVQEARQVRWLLIYAALQMLKSITRAPNGVKDTDLASYPLCVLTTGTPEWHNSEAEDDASPDAANDSVADLQLITPLPLTPGEDEARPDSEGHISIHPDCEAENAADYFSNSRRSSVNALDMVPQPLRVARLNRTASIRDSVSSGVSVLQRSFSMARRNSSRKSVQAAPKHRRTSSYEVVGSGYGISKEASRKEALDDLEGDTTEEVSAPTSTTTFSNPWQEFDFGLQNVAEEPTLNERHFDSAFGLDLLHTTAADFKQLEKVNEDAAAKRNSWVVGEAAFTARQSGVDQPTSATTYSSELDSLRSYLTDGCDTPATQYSSPSESPTPSQRASVDLEKSPVTPQKKQRATAQRHISLMDSRQTLKTLNAGVYSPSGASAKATLSPASSRYSRSMTDQAISVKSEIERQLASASSSVFDLGSQRAGGKDAQEARGRSRTRVPGEFAGFSFSFDD
jgi:hypothetical protein